MNRFLIALTLLLAACSEEGAVSKTVLPVRMTEEAVGHYCQMIVLDHEGPKAQVHLADNAQPIWFVQVRDALAFDRMPDQPARVAAIFVSDMGAANAEWENPGVDNWIPASEAYYVAGSAKRGGMGAPDFIPFAKREDALAFSSLHGGKVIAYDEIEDAEILAPVDVELSPKSRTTEGVDDMALNRRRFLAVAAAGSAAGLTGLFRPGAAAQAIAWHGVALGAPARIVVDGDPDEARSTIASVRAEIDRLEGLFSLYRRDSAISRLNRMGRLDRPDPDFLALLSVSDRMHAASSGAFDPTIQPAWQSLAAKYRGDLTDETEVSGPTGWSKLVYSAEGIAFRNPGMAVSLNGIAQGFITDRIAGLLRAAGLKHVLVDMGELRSIGTRSDGTGWPVRIPAAGRRLHLAADRALAVSHTLGTTFDGEGRVGRIIDPQTGNAVTANRVVAVEAPSAVVADGLSTAFCASGTDGVPGLLEAFPGARVVAASPGDAISS